MNIETDLGKLKALGETRYSENEHFKQHLKSIDQDFVDTEVMRINRLAEAAIDCTTCGNCCKNLMVNIDDPAVIRLADYMQLPESEFRKKFVETGSFMQFLNAIPCQFLDGKKCSIYEIRPDECREFPRLDRPGFTKRMFATFSHYGMCPLIFNTVEELKKTTGFFVEESDIKE